MNGMSESIASQLKVARNAAGLSQRQLTAMTGLQQAQLSKIENGTVDPRLSSLQALGRALGLELVWVPRQSLQAVNSVIALKGTTQKRPVKPAYSLDEDEDG